MKNSKKITSGILALLFGIAIVFTQSAFKGSSPEASQLKAPVTLYYNGPNLNEANVETEAYWTTAPNEESCDDFDEAACRIIVDESAVDYTGMTPKLKSDAALQADLNSPTSTAFVTGSSVYSIIPENRSH